MSKTSESAKNRIPPPAKTRFRKGTSGNPKGRPKGSIGLERLTRNFALRRQTVTISGKPKKLSRLEIAILKLQALAATGKPSAAALLDKLRDFTVPQEAEQAGGVLLVPAPLTPEEWIARATAENADKIESGTEVNVETEEFLKAVRGEPSELGEALLAFHRKYRGGNPN